jgi:hypothetical protein
VNAAQKLAEQFLKECIRVEPGDIGGRLRARDMAKYLIDEAAKKLEAELVGDSFEG